MEATCRSSDPINSARLGVLTIRGIPRGSDRLGFCQVTHAREGYTSVLHLVLCVVKLGRGSTLTTGWVFVQPHAVDLRFEAASVEGSAHGGASP